MAKKKYGRTKLWDIAPDYLKTTITKLRKLDCVVKVRLLKVKDSRVPDLECLTLYVKPGKRIIECKLIHPDGVAFNFEVQHQKRASNEVLQEMQQLCDRLIVKQS